MQHTMQRTLGIIGLGHIGGSLAISLRENGFVQTVLGTDALPDRQDKALRRRIVDEALPLDDLIDRADLILLATPVDAMMQLLPQLLDRVDRQVIFDVGSTKQRLLDTVRTHPRRGRFVASHPMAGTENSGIDAAIPHLFDHKYTVLCDVDDSDPDALETVRALYHSIPMQIAELDAAEHDVHTAYVSHISHVSSFALALTVLQKEKDEHRIFELASSGFGSTVRLAKSSPDMWMPIFRQNRDNVLDVLDEYINTLARFRTQLIKQDFEGLHQSMTEANAIRRILK